MRFRLDPRFFLATGVILVGVWACPQPAAVPPPAAAPDLGVPEQPGSASSKPADHNTSTAPVTLKEIFRVPDVQGSDDVAIKVGDRNIKKADLEARLRQLQIQIVASGMPDGISRWEVLEGTIDMMIERTIIEVVAAEAGIKPDPAFVDQFVKDIEEKAKADKAFGAFLAQAGNTREQRILDGQHAAVINGLQQHLARKMQKETLEEAKAYYKAHLNDFTEKAGREIWRINVKAPINLPERDRAAAKTKMEDMAKKLQKKPAEFESFAQSHSEGGKASSGGYIGFVPRNTFGLELDAKIWAAKPGSVLPLEEDQNGFFIYKVGKERKERVMPFEEVEEEIFRRTQGQKMNDAVGKMITEWKKTHPIEINIQEYKDIPRPSNPGAPPPEKVGPAPDKGKF